MVSLGKVIINKGVFQGSPISAFLFIIYDGSMGGTTIVLNMQPYKICQI